MDCGLIVLVESFEINELVEYSTVFTATTAQPVAPPLSQLRRVGRSAR